METALSNKVILNRDNGKTGVPRRTLDLANIRTKELQLLTPLSEEIVPQGTSRDGALIAYTDRLRNSYRTNQNGFRDGMILLAQTHQAGHTISVSCPCRSGEICHADVVKMAIEKVSLMLSTREQGALTQDNDKLRSFNPSPNPRTQRAVNELLSVNRSDLALAKIDDTQGRSAGEHASYLNKQSQFARDLYERGAVVRDGILISPTEGLSITDAPVILTQGYAVQKLQLILNDDKRAKELAPLIVEYGRQISGQTSDRASQIQVFNWIYESIEGKQDFLTAANGLDRPETSHERIDRNLNEIAKVADEMSQLEPIDKFVSLDDRHDESPDRSEKYAENVILNQFERTELSNNSLSKMALEMSKDELDRWIGTRLPALDRQLESGMPVKDILMEFQDTVYVTAVHDPSNKQAAIDDLKFASAYIDHQLRQPDSKLRHFNQRYRKYATMLEHASSRSEVMEAASRIRSENAKIGREWEGMSIEAKTATPRALTQKEMRYLFTEISPSHYTTEMTAARLSYLHSGASRELKYKALLNREIEPSREAGLLLKSLESRMERKYLSDSLSATKHFLISLTIPDKELKHSNQFDHRDLYSKLPSFERDYIYTRALEQKDRLDALQSNSKQHEQTFVPSNRDQLSRKFSEVRQGIKNDIIAFMSKGSNIDEKALRAETAMIVEKSFSANGVSVDLSRQMSDTLTRRLTDGLIEQRDLSNTKNLDNHDQSLEVVAHAR